MEEKTTDLSTILSISGKPGLYKKVAQAKNGLIVESLTDGKRFQAFAHDKVSSLDDISIFTESGDKSLKEILQKIREITDNGQAPDPKSDNQKLKEFFEKVMPDYDRERVYVSHIKKIYLWYNLLLEKNMLDFTEEPEEADESSKNEETSAESAPKAGTENSPEPENDESAG
ncbi:MAG TPA: hypothetical protein ENN08_02200 [Bacteroidales bacterium]|nr:hypothetical protein [Bacteroidales bacterium]